MDDNSPPDRRFSVGKFYCRPHVWRFDFLRAHRRRSGSPTDLLDLDEKSHSRIESLISQVGDLIQEYSRTANRVGADIDQVLLLTVFESLKREPLNIQHPRMVAAGAEAKERFLAESMHDELLELKSVSPGASDGAAPEQLTPNEWRTCLGVLADSIAQESSVSDDD